MSKGFELVVNRARCGDVFYNRDWSKATEWTITEDMVLAVSDEIKLKWDNTRERFLMRNLFGEFKVSIVCNPDTKFDYYICDSCVCDGTLYFTTDIMRKIVFNVLTVQTYDKRLEEQLFKKDFDEIRWTIGNFAVLSEHGNEFAPEEKPWMKERVTVLLPLKMEIIKWVLAC